jgi:hypothetical protein
MWETAAKETKRYRFGDWIHPANGRDDEENDSIDSNDSNPNEEPDDMNADLVDEGDATAPTTLSRKKAPKGKGWVFCKKKDGGARQAMLHNVGVIQPDQDTHKVLRMSPKSKKKRRWTAHAAQCWCAPARPKHSRSLEDVSQEQEEKGGGQPKSHLLVLLHLQRC